MDILTRSPAKTLKEKCSRSFDLFSPIRSKELFLLQERKFSALNLSIRRKRNSLKESAETLRLTKTSPSLKLLFDNEEIFSLAEKSLSVISNLQTPIKFGKRKYSNIINEERENYEPVEFVDLSSPFIAEENSDEIAERDSGCLKRVRLSSKSF